MATGRWDVVSRAAPPNLFVATRSYIVVSTVHSRILSFWIAENIGELARIRRVVARIGESVTYKRRVGTTVRRSMQDDIIEVQTQGLIREWAWIAES